MQERVHQISETESEDEAGFDGPMAFTEVAHRISLDDSVDEEATYKGGYCVDFHTQPKCTPEPSLDYSSELDQY